MVDMYANVNKGSHIVHIMAGLTQFLIVQDNQFLIPTEAFKIAWLKSLSYVVSVCQWKLPNFMPAKFTCYTVVSERATLTSRDGCGCFIEANFCDFSVQRP